MKPKTNGRCENKRIVGCDNTQHYHTIKDQTNTLVPEQDLCQKSRHGLSLVSRNEISAESWMQTYHLFLAETRSFFLAANLVLMGKRKSKQPKSIIERCAQSSPTMFNLRQKIIERPWSHKRIVQLDSTVQIWVSRVEFNSSLFKLTQVSDSSWRLIQVDSS